PVSTGGGAARGLSFMEVAIIEQPNLDRERNRTHESTCCRRVGIAVGAGGGVAITRRREASRGVSDVGAGRSSVEYARRPCHEYAGGVRQRRRVGSGGGVLRPGPQHAPQDECRIRGAAEKAG